MVMANLCFSVLVCAVSPRCLCAPPPLRVWPLLVASVGSVLGRAPARPGWASRAALPLGLDGLPCSARMGLCLAVFWGLLWSDTTWRDAWCDEAVQGKGASRYHRL